MSELTIFGYRHGASALHRIDVRFKIIFLIMVSLASIKANAWALFVLTFVLTVMFMQVGLSVKSTFKALCYVFVLLVFIFLARVFSSTGSPVFEFSGISVAREGVYDGATVCWYSGRQQRG